MSRSLLVALGALALTLEFQGWLQGDGYQVKVYEVAGDAWTSPI